MAFNESDVTALETAIKSGVLKVAYADRTVQYQTLDEMMKLLALMRGEVEASASTGGDRTTYASFSRD